MNFRHLSGGWELYVFNCDAGQDWSFVDAFLVGLKWLDFYGMAN
ncbi:MULTISPECIES: hypothetical protein [Chryseobacterium]|nr:hypothetical protein [Chryseobacterium sp. 2VB]